MSKIKTKQLDLAFFEKIEKAIANIFGDLPTEYINKSIMSGGTFVKFFKNCIEQLNDPKNKMPLFIPSAYEAAIKNMENQSLFKHEKQIELNDFKNMENQHIMSP